MQRGYFQASACQPFSPFYESPRLASKCMTPPEKLKGCIDPSQMRFNPAATGRGFQASVFSSVGAEMPSAG
jgi:hypothetical protein